MPKPHPVAAVRPSPSPNSALPPSLTHTLTPALLTNFTYPPTHLPTCPPAHLPTSHLPTCPPAHLPTLHRQNVRQTLGDKVPVLMISASRHLGLVHNCLKAGADMCADPHSDPNTVHLARGRVAAVLPHSHPHPGPNLVLT